MYIPSPRERVVVQGRSHYYFVVATDPGRQIAYVVDLREHGYVEQVAFSALSRYSIPGSTAPNPRNGRTPELLRDRKAAPHHRGPHARDLGLGE